jgi:hypothetical protein
MDPVWSAIGSHGSAPTFDRLELNAPAHQVMWSPQKPTRTPGIAVPVCKPALCRASLVPDNRRLPRKRLTERGQRKGSSANSSEPKRNASDLGRLAKGYSNGEPRSRHRGGLPGGRPERPLPDEWRERLRAEREGWEGSEE